MHKPSFLVPLLLTFGIAASAVTSVNCGGKNESSGTTDDSISAHGSGGAVTGSGDQGSGYGDGYGYGDNDAYPLDCGYSYGIGYGFGDGYGYGYGFGDGYGYASAYGYSCHVSNDVLPQHQFREIPTNGVLDVDFVWRSSAGHAAPDDLSIIIDGDSEPVFQIFSTGGSAFARAGLEVKPLQANTDYRVVLHRSRNIVLAKLEHNGQILFNAARPTFFFQSFADFRTPGVFFRQNVTFH